MKRSDLLLVAGEASGDLHGARLLAALRRRRPDLTAFGLGSDELAAAGLDLVGDSREISVVGLVEVAGVFERARELFDRILVEVEKRRPRVAVLVDFPDFNLRLARHLAWAGIPIVYYVSPQIWAWRRGRVRTIAQTVSKMLVLFPFEVPFYRRHRVPVTHVGHPLVDEVPELPQAWDGGATTRPERFRVALLPGSRKSEVRSMLPVMAESIRRLERELPVEATWIQAPSLPADELEKRLADLGQSGRIVREGRFEAIADSHLALCASGTATLEVGLLRTPLVVLYRLSPVTYWAARMLVRVPNFSLVNLVLGRSAVPELLQRDAEPERIAAIAGGLLRDPERLDAMHVELGGVRARLGAPGASERAAEEVLEVLDRGGRAA
ncbi:MAG: lipid-A-disaccharide synthase [Acidobacteria bacterium]|nr:lipid-A-disaccharide synthase [Acidobacteriota bacterium]MCB9378785.1 lipid-A-disaccharide synthase [Holophagales bacterium]